MAQDRVLIGKVVTDQTRGRAVRAEMDRVRREAAFEALVQEAVRKTRARYRRKMTGWFWLTVSAGLLTYLQPVLWPVLVPPGLEWLWNVGLWSASLADDFDERVRKVLRRDLGL